MKNCQVSQAEIENDLSHVKASYDYQYSLKEKREEVIRVADDLIDGLTLTLYRNNIPYTFSGSNSVMGDLIEHPLYENVIRHGLQLRKYKDGDEDLTINDLALRVARHGVAVCLFDEQVAEDIGFIY